MKPAQGDDYFVESSRVILYVQVTAVILWLANDLVHCHSVSRMAVV